MSQNVSEEPVMNRVSDEVLGAVLVNQKSLASGIGGLQDDDLALAKMLQEQERAFLMLSQGHTENEPPNTEDPHSIDGLTDEELALRIQQQEAADFENRLLALAGVAPGEDGDEDLVDNPDDDSSIDPDNLSYEELTVLGDVAGTVAVGVPDDKIDQLLVNTFRGVAAAGTEGEEQCAICRVEFSLDDGVKVLPCNHYYHVDCIGQWLRHKKACPVCGVDVIQD